MNLRGRRVIAVALSTTLLVAACGRGDDRSAAVDPAELSGGTLHVASVGDVDALDPLIAYSAESWQVIRATTRQLVTYAGNKDGIGKDTEVVPDLAESWDISPDRKTYTFHLRDNINFSGASTRPITAQDFVYAVKRFPDPNAQVSAITYYNALFEGFKEYSDEFAKVPTGDLAAVKNFIDSHDISGLKAVDDKTLQLTLTQPASDILDILTLNFVTPLPEEVVSKYFADSLEFRKNYVSSGPYYIESLDPGKQLTLAKVPEYNAAGDPRKAYADKIVFDTTVSSADAVSQQLQTGTADIGLYVRAFPANVIAQYKKTDPEHLHASASGSAIFISQNNPADPKTPAQQAFKDLRVRQAFNYSLNRADVVRGLGGPDSAIPSNEILTSTIVGYTGKNPYPTPEDKGDPDKAKALLAEAGKPGLTVNVAYRNNPEFEKIATSVQTSAARAGINVKLTPIAADSWGAFDAFLGDKTKLDQWDLAITNWTPDWQGNSARMTLGGWLDSDFAPGGTWNGVTYHNPRLNEAVNRAFAAQDPTADWQEANTIATEDLAWFPLIERVKTVPTSDRVTNWTWQSLGNNADITNIAVNG
ncbi:extracellular solute-binding protein [Mycolicibacterium mageritense DSM 44476 = CIP 104973]|uniref:ABC transporter substrate-binding protein n=1 Tax=Mycolicibacterium mageritense TaxID=53462 RepID=A0ABM7I5U7_MYCME|nr:ABC transporter substrate-binding protein [Mycolicibacterium mageritense]MCC9182719.1 ABC transporter substrate-binding protein [Mycolicibacterium mageritense]BBX38309.1 ABC transporter substrate-binding protein [Mycolicibacterium mageritense]GJJ22639.1 ABC transporter substrate-binding protein [Mycolicibacterium mageritense]CDO26958.1 extracellular solute-binding protein [Mycolicibacterium mageritense DSM 44476 = CIP 104973]